MTRPLLGFCTKHQNKPAIATEQKLGEKKRFFCEECWYAHKYGPLGLRPIPPLKTSIGPQKVTQKVQIKRIPYKN